MKKQFTEKQKYAYMLTKNFIFDSSANLKNYQAFKEDIVGSSDIEDEMQAITESGIKMVFHGEKGYPNNLLNLPDSPLMLFIKSKTDPEGLFNSPAANFNAVIGTRDIDEYGRRMTWTLIGKLTGLEPKPIIVSGLALGVDKSAHIAALENELKTIAVLPTGLDTIYPHAHTELAEMIAETPGCALVSPFAPRTAPEATNFLLRNRVIAGLADTVTVVQAKIKGGAIMTAKLAYDLEKEIYAIPGRADDVRCAGCNKLIADEVAHCLTF